MKTSETCAAAEATRVNGFHRKVRRLTTGFTQAVTKTNKELADG
jgi:hypothetical protein